jgi:protein SCO1/2
MVATAALLGAGCGVSRSSSPSKQRLLGERALGSSIANDFALRDQDGRIVRLSRLRGKVILLTFLYTSCPDVCPLTAAVLGDVLRRLGSDRRSVRVIAVSVDPHGDTRSSVRAFISKLKLPPEFRYLTGTATQLRPVWQAYNLLVEPRNIERVTHSAFVLGIDENGDPRVFYRNVPDESAVLHDVRALLGSYQATGADWPPPDG